MLLPNQEYLALIHRVAHGEQQTLYLPVRLGTQFVLHLHGFQNHDDIALAYGVARCHQPLDDLGLQGGAEFGHGAIVSAAG